MEAREEELERELSSCNVEALTMERFTAHISSVFHSFSSFSFLLSIPFLILFLILPILEFLAKEKESWEKRKEEEEQPWEDEEKCVLLSLTAAAFTSLLLNQHSLSLVLNVGM